MKIAAILGAFIAPILKPIILEALREFTQDTAEVAKPNADLESEWLRNTDHIDQTRHDLRRG